MILFKDIPYERINMDEFKGLFLQAVTKFTEAKSFPEAFYSLMDLDNLRKKYVTMAVICEARNTMDVNDEFYKNEAAYINKISPEYDELENVLSKAILQTPYREEFEKYIGKETFIKAELKSKSFSKEIMEDLREENILSARYSELVANLMAKTDEGMVPLSSLGKFLGSEDRQVRAKYSAIWEETFASISDDLDDLFHKLVQIRHKIARKMGEPSYTNIGYYTMNRTSYGKEHVERFREAVKKKIVPLVNKLFEEQKDRLGFEYLYNYDEDTNFIGKKLTATDDILGAFGRIYSKLSNETDVFYKDLIASSFFDLEIRPGKIMGAYANYVPTYSMPFVFMTYNGTPGAVKTFAHETGHGFHSYSKRGHAFSFTRECSSDLAEIHSMAMEFIIWPYLDEIYPEDQIEAYKYLHIKNALAFICYGSAVDEFQQTIYDNPNMLPDGRLDLWKRLEKEYQPWKCYETDVFLDQGRAWQRQTHIYKWPFYYIDYVLANVCAMQIHFLYEEDRAKGWECYRNILDKSGSMGFLDTITSAGLDSPFNESVIDELAKKTIDLMSNFKL